MKRILLPCLFATLGIFILQSGTAFADGDHKKHSVVYQLNSADLAHEKATLNNINNHIKSPSGPSTRIYLVIHGGGYHLLTSAKTDPQLQANIDNLKLSGVKIKVCNNTLESNRLDYKTDLYDVHKEDIVPSGVAYITDKQFEGWAYMHP
ncbi:MAG: DsrE family protein [Halothiobacillus sp.]